jgi:hypothetical protein
MIEITYNDAVRAMNNAIMAKEEGPEYVYVKTVAFEESDEAGGDPYLVCTYVHPDADGNLTQPGCLVGAALIDLGIPVETLAEINQDGFGASNLLSYLGGKGVVKATDKAKRVFSNAQSKQDRGWSWGGAVEYAVTRVAEYKWDENEAGPSYN